MRPQATCQTGAKGQGTVWGPMGLPARLIQKIWLLAWRLMCKGLPPYVQSWRLMCRSGALCAMLAPYVQYWRLMCSSGALCARARLLFGPIFFLMPNLIPNPSGSGQGRRKCNLNLATGGPTQVARNCRVIFSKRPRDKVDGLPLRNPVSKYAGRQEMPPPNTKNRAGTKLPRSTKCGPLAWKWPG